MENSSKFKNRDFIHKFIKLVFYILTLNNLESCAHKRNDYKNEKQNNEAPSSKELKQDSQSSQPLESPHTTPAPRPIPSTSQTIIKKTFLPLIEENDLDQNLDELKRLAKDAYDYINLIDPSDRPQPRSEDAERLRSMEESGALKSFDGTESDGYIDKSSGFIVFDSKKEIVTITFHGTRSGKKELNNILSKKVITGTEGWSTNLDTQLISANDLEFHQGFYNKYFRKDNPSGLSIGEQIDKIANDILKEWEKAPQKSRQNIRIRITGHSQGAAMAAIAVFDLSKRLEEGNLWGINKEKNSTSNRIIAYLLSPPSITSSITTLNVINALIDSRNVIAEYYLADLVTNIPVYSNEIEALTQLAGIYAEKKFRHPLVPGYHYALELPEELAEANKSLKDKIIFTHFGSEARMGYYDPDVVPNVKKELLVAPMRMKF